MNFSLYQRPQAIIFLDDDADYLSVIPSLLPPHRLLYMYTQAYKCLQRLEREPMAWEEDASMHDQMVERWRGGEALIPQILNYWKLGNDRFGLTKVVVVDYAMPNMSGVDFLSKLWGWSGSRVLLTGQANDRVAVDAFNRGLLEQFLPKQTQDIGNRLLKLLDDLLAEPDLRHNQAWRSVLTLQQYKLLQMDATTQSLKNLIQKQSWVEYVVLGEPFGILGLSDTGQVSWLQLETRESLVALVEMAQLANLSPQDIKEISERRMLTDIELQQSLLQPHNIRTSPAFPIDSSGQLWGALFALPESNSPGPERSYQNYLKQHNTRAILD